MQLISFLQLLPSWQAHIFCTHSANWYLRSSRGAFTKAIATHIELILLSTVSHCNPRINPRDALSSHYIVHVHMWQLEALSCEIEAILIIHQGRRILSSGIYCRDHLAWPPAPVLCWSECFRSSIKVVLCGCDHGALIKNVFIGYRFCWIVVCFD